jgi:8-oxo-dGTP pyrophosphatase MutT (NUDIX family)
MIKRWKAFFHRRASSPVSSHGYRWSICNWFYHGTITCWTNQVSRPRFLPACRRAAVLVDLAACPGEVRGILTPRTIALPGYSGQIAIPGGKIEARDKSPAATALCEAREEIGLDAGHVEPLGYPDPYPTGPGFSIVPVVAKAAAPVAIKINPDTLIEAFEVPFAFIINAANHALRHEQLDGKTRHFHAMPYGALNIWSVTAGILRNLYERLYS